MIIFSVILLTSYAVFSLQDIQRMKVVVSIYNADDCGGFGIKVLNLFEGIGPKHADKFHSLLFGFY